MNWSARVAAGASLCWTSGACYLKSFPNSVVPAWFTPATAAESMPRRISPQVIARKQFTGFWPSVSTAIVCLNCILERILLVL
jgi:hypothetical protein